MNEQIVAFNTSPLFCSPTRIVKHCRDDIEVWFGGNVWGFLVYYLPSRSLIKKCTALPINIVVSVICTQTDKSKDSQL